MDTMRICSYLWTVFIVVWLVAALRTKRARERMDFGSRLVYSIPVFAGCYLLFSDSFSGWLQEHVIPKMFGSNRSPFCSPQPASVSRSGRDFTLVKTGAVPLVSKLTIN